MMRLLSLVLAGVLVSGCGLLRDRGQDYQGAVTIPRLKVPADLDDQALGTQLKVPDIGTTAIRSDQEFRVPRPVVFYAESGNEVVNLDRTPEGKLLMVEQPREEVWKEVKAYLAFNETGIAVEDPQAGFVETEWIEQEDSGPGFFSRLISRLTFQEIEGPVRDKLRIYITPAEDSPAGVHRTAIRIAHLRTSTRDDSEPDWAGSGSDVDYRTEVMYDLLRYLSKSAEQTTARALENRRRDRSLAFLGRDSDGQPVLKLTSDIDTAWQRISEALRRGAFDVGSSDRSLGKFYMTYTTTLPVKREEGPGGIAGFFAWLHGDREDLTLSSDAIDRMLGVEEDAAEQRKYSSRPVQPKTEQELLQEQEGFKIWVGDQVVYVFGKSPSALRKEEDEDSVTYSGRFQLQLIRRSSGVYVSVLDDLARPAPVEVAEEILWKLKENLGERS